jgi:VCBS repeat-containing protein
VLANDSDPDGDVLSVTEATSASGAVVTINPDNTLSYTLGDHQSLGVNESANDTITYTVDDGEGGAVSETVVVTITGVNDAPTVTGVEVIPGGLENASHGIVTAEDPDANDVVTFSLDGDGVGTYGNFAIDPNGNWQYIAYDVGGPEDEGLVGENFDLFVSDGNGGEVGFTIDVEAHAVSAEEEEEAG